MVTLATNQGVINNNDGENLSLMHVQIKGYDYVMSEEILGNSMGKHWLGVPQSMDCREDGMVIIEVRCKMYICQNTLTEQVMTVGKAHRMVKLVNKRQKRDLDKLKTAHWETNMFQQWIQYSVQAMFKAKKRPKDDCIACYNAKKLPALQIIPGSKIGDCPDVTECFAHCAMQMAGGLASLSKDHTICPRALNSSINDVMSTFSLPPVVQKPAELIFPFCIARGKELETVTNRSSRQMWTTDRLVTCSNRTWYPPTAEGNLTYHIKFCQTSPNATIRCEQVVPDGGHVIYEFQPSSVSQYRILSLARGSVPLGDIFWMCHNETQMLATLPPQWEGICAPVMLTGQLKLIANDPIGINVTSNEITNRVKRSTPAKHEWKTSDEVYITWDQIPYGVPEEQVAIGSDWIKSGRGAGSVPIYGSIVNAQYIARNSRWVNLLWYNQQRFINFTIKGLDLVKEQLHATSLMVLQHRFVLESRMAGDQGICDYIGEDCCTLIPMHTDVNGSLTGVLQEMKRMRDEHVLQSNWNTQLKGFWDWFHKLGRGKYLEAAGMILGAVILIILIVMCCIIPLVRGLVSRLVVSVTGQFPVVEIQLDQAI